MPIYSIPTRREPAPRPKRATISLDEVVNDRLMGPTNQTWDRGVHRVLPTIQIQSPVEAAPVGTKKK